MCRCLIPSKSPASAVCTCNWAGRLRRMRQRVGHFHVCHAEFIEAVLQECLLFRSEVALGFLGDHAQCVDGLPCADQVHSGLAALLVHEAELHHGGHVERSHEALKTHFEFLCRVAAQFYSRVQIARRLLVSIVLRLLLGGGGRFGDIRGGRGCRDRGDGRHRRGRRRDSRSGRGRRDGGWGLFFRRIAQFSVGGEQALVAYFEFAFFASFLSHMVYLSLLESFLKVSLAWNSSDRERCWLQL